MKAGTLRLIFSILFVLMLAFTGPVAARHLGNPGECHRLEDYRKTREDLFGVVVGLSRPLLLLVTGWQRGGNIPWASCFPCAECSRSTCRGQQHQAELHLTLTSVRDVVVKGS